MPQWLRNQLRRAFHGKNRRQVRLLNECWFLYQSNEQKKKQAEQNTNQML